MTLSEQIRFARQKAFLTQKRFAELLNVSVGTINRWENGKSKPTISAMGSIRMICEEYHVPFEPIEKEWFETEKGAKK